NGQTSDYHLSLLSPSLILLGRPSAESIRYVGIPAAIARLAQSLVPLLRARNRWNAMHMSAPAAIISAFRSGSAFALYRVPSFVWRTTAPPGVGPIGDPEPGTIVWREPPSASPCLVSLSPEGMKECTVLELAYRLRKLQKKPPAFGARGTGTLDST